MSQPIDTSDTSKCPLCGQENECAMAKGDSPESCWCMTASMDPKALASIPAEVQGKVCICQRCASPAAASD